MSHAGPPLEETLDRARRGERGAQRELLAFLYPPVRKHLGFVLGFHPCTDDAVQESMLAILHALPSFAGRSSLKTWALRIASRTAVRHRKAVETERKRAVPLVDEIPGHVFELDVDARSDLQALASCLATLAPKKREAFILMDVMELTAAEAAKVLGTFANTAASRCRHARAELGPRLARALGPEAVLKKV